MAKHIFLDDALYFISFNTDQHRPILTRDLLKECLLFELKRAKKIIPYKLYAYAILPTHVHLLIKVGKTPNKLSGLKARQAQDPEAKIFSLIDRRQLADISRFINQLKGASSRRISRLNESADLKVGWAGRKVGRAGKAAGLKAGQPNKVWQAGYFEEVIRSEKMFWQKLNYIHKNPVKDGLCQNPADYRYSSYSYYLKKYGEGFMGKLGKLEGIKPV